MVKCKQQLYYFHHNSIQMLQYRSFKLIQYLHILKLYFFLFLKFFMILMVQWDVFMVNPLINIFQIKKNWLKIILSKLKYLMILNSMFHHLKNNMMFKLVWKWTNLIITFSIYNIRALKSNIICIFSNK